MDKLAEALAEAIRSGSAQAGPAISSYFTFRMWDDVIGYGVPSLTFIAITVIVCRTVKWGIKARNERESERWKR